MTYSKREMEVRPFVDITNTAPDTSHTSQPKESRKRGLESDVVKENIAPSFYSNKQRKQAFSDSPAPYQEREAKPQKPLLKRSERSFDLTKLSAELETIPV